MRWTTLFSGAIVGICVTTPALTVDGVNPCGPAATIVFSESAPRDRVTIRNQSPEGWSVAAVTWALEGSAGDLIFDTIPGGAGYSVAQPFQSSGGATLSHQPGLADGDRTLDLVFSEFAPGALYAFTIDLDDRISGQAGTMIEGGVLTGASLEVVFVRTDGRREALAGEFDTDATARVAAACTS